MAPLRILRLLLFAAAFGWGTFSFAGRGTIKGDESLLQSVGGLQHMSPDQRDDTFRGFDEELARASTPKREQRLQWLKRKLAALSPEERDLLHRQILEHWQRMTPDQRQQVREAHPLNQQRLDPAQSNAGQQEYCPKPLSPDERREFHHWMRIRRGGPPQ